MRFDEAKKNILTLPISDPSIATKPIVEDKKHLDPLVAIKADHLRIVSTADLRFGERRIESPQAIPQMREAIYHRLEKALNFLPHNMGIAVYEGYRAPSIQRQYFQAKLQELKAKAIKRGDDNPSETDLIEEASKWVANPDGALVPPHSTGAAIDVQLYQFDASGQHFQFVDVGKFGTIFGENPHPETLSTVGLSKEQSDNRKLLLNAMVEVGFVNYGNEHWHFSWGDQAAATVLGEPAARYGAIE